MNNLRGMLKKAIQPAVCNKIVMVLYGVSVVIIAVMLIYLGIVDNINIISLRQDAECRIIREYSVEEKEDGDAPAGVHKIYTWTMPEVKPGDNCISFYLVHQYASVYMDGELIYSIMPDEKLLFGKTIGSSQVMIPLYPEDSGRQMSVVITPAYKSFRNRNVEFIMGSQLAIYTQRLKADLPQIIIGGIAILVGILFVVVAVCTLLSERMNSGLAMLGTFSVMLGLWRLTDTRFSPFMMQEKPVFLFYISLTMLMLGGVPLLKTIQYHYGRKDYPMFTYLCLAMSLVCMLQIVLQLVNILDFRETLIITHIMLVLGVFLSAGVMIYDERRRGRTGKQGLGKGIFIACVTGITGDVLAFYIKGNSSGLLFTLTAFLIYIIISGMVSIWGYVEWEKKKKEQEAELAASRISIMMSQIQPHFLYNTLNTIYYLCDKNPGRAKKAISDFADYLRGNVDSLERKEPVAFEKELEHVKIYLSLEKMRFEEELEIVYDIETTAFRIPILALQPLVENAVRHGVGKSEKGGTVTISTREIQDSYEVAVMDDGVGYDVNEVKNDGRTHIGIENVRKRLWEMCHATLEISSEKGHGCKAVITIPKEGEPEDNEIHGRLHGKNLSIGT